MKKSIIIGAGIAGIAASIRLAVKGHEVAIYEANTYAGGKLSEIHQAGFRFDAGPSLFTMPNFVEELFQISNKKIADYFEYHKLDRDCHYFYEDGTMLISYTDSEQFTRELETKLAINPQVVLDYLKQSEKIYNLTSKVFLEQSLHKVSNYFSKEIVKCIVNIHQLKLSTTLHKLNERKLKHPKLVQIFDRYATYNGSDPYRVSGIMSVIPHLEQGVGTFFPKKGMYGITKALQKLAEDLGVKFYFNQKVNEILYENQKITGIKVNNEKISCDYVVSNMDIVPTYKLLLKQEKLPYQLEKQERSTSAIIFYWGINRKFEELGLHNIFFSEDYPTEFQYLFQKKEVYDDPTVYVFISSKECTTDAPEGCENWFVMINTPSNFGQDWDEIIQRTRKNALEKLSRMLKTDISSLILSESILEPRTIESKTSSHLGSLYGTSSNHWLAAFLRHPNFSPKIKGLYFCGGSVHPGGGIPLCLLSAKIATELIS